MLSAFETHINSNSSWVKEHHTAMNSRHGNIYPVRDRYCLNQTFLLAQESVLVRKRPLASAYTARFTVCRFTDVTVGQPQIKQDYTVIDVTPQQCRLRDLTYSAEVRVDIEFTRGKDVVVAKGRDGQGHTLIGRMPIMLRSDRCLCRAVRPLPADQVIPQSDSVFPG